VVCLTADEEQALLAGTRAGTTEHRIAERAKIVLLAHQGEDESGNRRAVGHQVGARFKMATEVCRGVRGREAVHSSLGARSGMVAAAER
jgi:hypothetical protein